MFAGGSRCSALLGLRTRSRGLITLTQSCTVLSQSEISLSSQDVEASAGRFGAWISGVEVKYSDREYSSVICRPSVYLLSRYHLKAACLTLIPQLISSRLGSW